MAMVLRWAFGAAAVAGSFHGVSAASTVTPSKATATNGVPFTQFFLVNDPNPEYGNARSYTATGLPPGLTIIQTGLSKGIVNGTPTKAGTFNATITGWQNVAPGGNSSPHKVVFTVVSTGSPPTVSVAPPPPTVVEGTVLTLTATTSSNGPFTYQWLKGDIEVAKATNSVLTFNPVAITDGGSYTVRVANDFGTTFSSAVVFSVTPAAPTISAPPPSLAIHAGEPFLLTVGVSGTGPFTYQWLSNSVVMPGATASAYSVPSAPKSFAASYSVKVTNAGGSTTSSAGVVLVADPLALSPAQIDGSGDFVIRFLGLTNRLYSVEASTNLATGWNPLGSPVSGHGSAASVLDPTAGSSAKFYRVKTAN